MIVYSANLQHGQGTDGVTDYARQVSVFSAGGADLIGVQERSSPDTGWDAPLAAAGYAQAIYRPNQIGGGDGNAIWYKISTVTPLETYEKQLSVGATSPWDGGTNVDKCAVAAKVLISGKQFYFVNTHLCQNAGADADQSLFSAIRVAQINELLSWTNGTLTGLDRAIVGDMNFGANYLKAPSGFQIDLFTEAGYVDLWTRGIQDGRATANWGDRNLDGTPDMLVHAIDSRTHDFRVIDRGFIPKDADLLSFIAIEIPDLRANCSGALTGSPAFCPDVVLDQRTGTPDDYGVKPSDHNWPKFTLGFRGARKKQIAIAL